MLKRRVGVASVLGFGALLGLVTQHAVGSQKHKAVRATQSVTTRLSATSFFVRPVRSEIWSTISAFVISPS